MSDWTKISYYLYKGLSDYIDTCIKAKQVDNNEFKELKECVRIYSEHCIVSVESLKNKIKELEYFIE
ncbi:MAG: hypothetical protein ACOCZ5_03540 [bacterium]